MPAPIRLLIADDHLVFRLGLKGLLSSEPDMVVVGEATTGSQTVEKFKTLKPDVVVLDLRMPDGGGMRAVTAIREACRDARILMLSNNGNEEEVYQALTVGIRIRAQGRGSRRALRGHSPGACGETVDPVVDSVFDCGTSRSARTDAARVGSAEITGHGPYQS